MIFEYTDETESEIFSSTIRNHLMVFLSKQAENFPEYYDALLSAAEELEGRVLPILFDVDNEDNSRFLGFFNLRSVDAPAVRLLMLDNSMEKYAMDEPFTKEKYLSFVAAWEAGELLPLLMSEEIPETQGEGAYVVVGNSFDDQVRNSGKNVFINIYAPYSGHCKQLAPIWEKLAERYADVDDIRIAKMDATKNQARNLKFNEFPMLRYFLPSGDVVEYIGSRTLEDLIQFVERRGSDQVRTTDDFDL